MVRKLIFLITSLLFFGIFQQPAAAFTSSVPVELVIPETVLQIDGRASPNALVSIKESGVTIVSTTADVNGLFTASVARTAGIHTIAIEYTDVIGKKSQTNTQVISLQPQQTTLLNVFLSPTLTKSNQGSITNGSIIQLRGYTIPNAQVSLNINYGSFMFDTTSNVSGFYEFLVDSALIGDGNHIANTTSTSGAYLSDPSINVAFQVVPADEPSAPDIIVRPSQLPPPTTQTPDDGAVIDGNKVTIYGESVPEAQINVYENGIQIGSIFSDNLGQWSFEYTAISSPVTLSFEACINGRCSVLSKTLTLTFIFTLTYTSDDLNNNCGIYFTLEKYRFWGVNVGDKVILVKNQNTGEGIINIDWGDGTKEQFDSNSKDNNQIEHEYSNKGNYNGKITFSKNNTNPDCQKDRYFSVSVSSGSSSNDNKSILWFLILTIGLIGLNYIATKDKQKTVQSK